MKLTQSIFMTLAVFVSIVNCSDQKPKGWKDVVSFLNPLATFRPSIISSGHVQYFGDVSTLNSEQKNNLKQFVTKLKNVRLGAWWIEITGAAAYFITVGLNTWAVPVALLNVAYLKYIFEIRFFEIALDEKSTHENKT